MSASVCAEVCLRHVLLEHTRTSAWARAVILTLSVSVCVRGRQLLIESRVDDDMTPVVVNFFYFYALRTDVANPMTPQKVGVWKLGVWSFLGLSGKKIHVD